MIQEFDKAYVESVLCASVEKSFATNDFATITETDITGDWQQ